MRYRLGIALSSLRLSGTLLLPSRAVGRVEVLGLKASGEGEVGGRIFVDRPAKADRAKFEEYRNIPSGIFLDRLRLRLESQDGSYSLEFRARDAGEEDQNFFLRSSKLGAYLFEFEWDQLPHVFSGTARSPYRKTSQGVFELPDLLQTTLQGASAAARPNVLQSFRTTAPDIDLKTRWDTARFLITFTPTPDWDLRAEYIRTLKKGGSDRDGLWVPWR
jgi:Putative outer membrane beta-barrel porin, MtrB/PioB